MQSQRDDTEVLSSLYHSGDTLPIPDTVDPGGMTKSLGASTDDVMSIQAVGMRDSSKMGMVGDVWLRPLDRVIVTII